jgi:hypothetical protein
MGRGSAAGGVSWVIVVGLKGPDGKIEQREFTVHDERIFKIIRRIIFDKNATQEEIQLFAAAVERDPALAAEWREVQRHRERGWQPLTNG